MTEFVKFLDDGFDHHKSRDGEASAFIQWKGTDVCLDFQCECGAEGHIDGSFVYTVKCPQCGIVWEMPFILFPRKADDRTYHYWRENPVTFEQDEKEE